MCFQRVDGGSEVLGLDQDVVRIERADGENPDVRSCQWIQHGREYAHLVEREGASELDSAPLPLNPLQVARERCLADDRRPAFAE